MIPFIFLTAKANKAEVRQGMDLGADDYLTKPSTVEELLGASPKRRSPGSRLLHVLLNQPSTTPHGKDGKLLDC